MIKSAMLLLLGLSNPLAGLNLHPGGEVSRSVCQDAAGWRVEMRRDQFNGRTSCVLKRPGATYERGVVTFRFPSRTDTANAEFRIDGGAVQPVGAVAIEAAGLGAHLRHDNSNNPSGGLVAIPARLLTNANAISIRPNRKAGHRDFALRDLGAALAAAEGL